MPWKSHPPKMSSLQKVYWTMTTGREGAPYFRRYGRGLTSKPAISLKRVGGATVVRLYYILAMALFIGFTIIFVKKLGEPQKRKCYMHLNRIISTVSSMCLTSCSCIANYNYHGKVGTISQQRVPYLCMFCRPTSLRSCFEKWLIIQVRGWCCIDR